MGKENYFEEIQNWTPLSKMENATEEVYRDRIQKAYNVILPNSYLVLIPYIGSDEIVEYIYPELVALCPVTFILDIYNLKIRFIPNKYVPELKSLKFYLLDYFKLPISHEHIANKIYKEFFEQVKPKKMYLYIKTNIRGGIVTNIEVGEKI